MHTLLLLGRADGAVRGREREEEASWCMLRWLGSVGSALVLIDSSMYDCASESASMASPTSSGSGGRLFRPGLVTAACSFQ